MSAFAVSASSVRAVNTAIGLSSRIRVRAKLVAPVAKARTSSRAICVTTFARRASSSGGSDEEEDAVDYEFEETFLRTQMSNVDFLFGELEDAIKTISPEEKQAIVEADDFDDLPGELKNHVVAVHLKDLSETMEAMAEKLKENEEDALKWRFDPDLAEDALRLIIEAEKKFEALME